VRLPAREPHPGRAGLRLGSTAMTIRGAGGENFAHLARAVAAVLAQAANGVEDAGISAQVKRIAARYPIPFQ